MWDRWTTLGTISAILGVAWVVALGRYDPKQSSVLVPQPDEPNYYLNLLLAAGMATFGIVAFASRPYRRK